MILAAGADPSAADNDGWTPLHTAAMAGHTDLGARLVRAGASVRSEAYGKDGGSPLSYALFYAKAYMGAVLTPVYPDNLRAAAALGADVGRFFKGSELTPAAREGLGFYARCSSPPGAGPSSARRSSTRRFPGRRGTTSARRWVSS